MGRCGHTAGRVYEGQALVCEKAEHKEGLHCLFRDTPDGAYGVRAEVVFWGDDGEIRAVNKLIKGVTLPPPDWSDAPIFKKTPGAAPRQASPPAPRVKLADRLPGYVGDPCPKCFGLFVVRTGACMTCQSCGHNDGCG